MFQHVGEMADRPHFWQEIQKVIKTFHILLPNLQRTHGHTKLWQHRLTNLLPGYGVGGGGCVVGVTVADRRKDIST